MTLLNSLIADEILVKPAKVSSHAAICIGKILNKHIEIDQFSASIESFYLNKVKPSIMTPHSNLIIGHLKTIFKQCSKKKLGMLKDAKWPLECIDAVGMEAPAQLKYSLQKMLYPILDQLDSKTLRMIGDLVLKILKENIASLE